MDSIYPKVEASFVWTKDMNNELVNIYKKKTFVNKNTEDSTAKSAKLGKTF